MLLVALPLWLAGLVCYADGTDEPMGVLVDHKLAVELGVLGFSAIAVVASIYNLVVKDRPVKVGYLSSGGGIANYNASGQWTDISPFSGGGGGHHCSQSSSSSDGGSCGGGGGN